MRQLLARGGDVVYRDPWVLDVELDGALYQSVDWSVAELGARRLRGHAHAAQAVQRAAALGARAS